MRPVRISHRGRSAVPSPIRKLVPLADEARKRGIKVHALNIGQPDLVTPEAMWEAVRRHPPVLSYSPSTGLRELRAAFAGYYAGHEVALDPEEIIVTTGGSEAILFALGAVTDPGDEILIAEPLYANYLGFAHLLGVNVVPVPTSPEDGYHLPPRTVWEEKLTSRTRAIVLCHPGNPTGTVYEGPEVEMLLGLAQEWGLFLLSDEVYREFCYDGRDHRSLLSYSEATDRVILVDSISKRFSACGARIGCLGTRNSEVLSAVTRFAQARLSPPSLGQWMALAALELPTSYHDSLRLEYQRRRDVVMEELGEIEGVLCRKPRGAFYAMATLPVENADDFASWMLREFEHEGETTFVAPGNGFYATPGAGGREVRIAYVLEEGTLRQALRVLKAGLISYTGRGERPAPRRKAVPASRS